MKSSIKMQLHVELLQQLISEMEAMAFDMITSSDAYNDQCLAYVLLQWCQEHRERMAVVNAAWAAPSIGRMVKIKIDSLPEMYALRFFLARHHFDNPYMVARMTDWMSEIDQSIVNHPFRRFMAYEAPRAIQSGITLDCSLCDPPCQDCHGGRHYLPLNSLNEI